MQLRAAGLLQNNKQRKPMMLSFLTSAWGFVRQYWQLIVALVLAITLYFSGYQSGKESVQEELATLKQQHAEQAAAAQTEYAQTLAKANEAAVAWQTRAAQADQELATANNQTRANAAETKKGINDAIAKDKADSQCIDGFGANGLQQYKHALGY
jgi:uncharacterized protein HemX